MFRDPFEYIAPVRMEGGQVTPAPSPTPTPSPSPPPPPPPDLDKPDG